MLWCKNPQYDGRTCVTLPTSTPAVSQSQALLLIAVDSLCMCRVVVVETKYPHHRQAHSRTLSSKISQSERSPDNNWPIIARESVPSTSCTHIKYSSLQVVADRQMEPRPIQSLPYNLPLQTLWKIFKLTHCNISFCDSRQNIKKMFT